MRAILEIGLGNAVVAGVLGLLAMAVGRWCRRPAVVHAVWVLVLVKLVTPPLRTMPLGGLWARRSAAVPAVAEAPLSERSVDRLAGLAPIVQHVDAPLTFLPRFAAESLPDRRPVSIDLSRLPLAPKAPVEPVKSLQSMPERPAVVKEPVYRTPIATAPAAPVHRLTVGPIVAILPQVVLTAWCAGSLWCVVTVVVRLRRFRTLVRGGAPAPPAVLAQVRSLSDQLGVRRPASTMMPGDVSPMVYGLFGRNRLLIPATLWGRLTAPQQQSLLAHELAHLYRGDHWVRALEVVATVLYWWHPATWWARRELREAEEQCCDAWVGRLLPGSAAAYASALLDAVDFMSAAPIGSTRRPASAAAAATPAWASGLSEFQSLKRRLIMIKSPSRVSPKLSAASLAAVLSLAGLSLPLSPIFAQTSTTPPAADVEPPSEPQAPQAPRAPQPAPAPQAMPAPRPKPAPAPKVAPVAPKALAATSADADGAKIIAGLRAQSAAPQAVPDDPFGGSGNFKLDADPSTAGRDADQANAKRSAQLQRAQADVKRLSAELEAATRRLKDLEQSNRAAEDGKRAAEAGKRAAEAGKRAAERAAEAGNRAVEKWKMEQDRKFDQDRKLKLWQSGVTPDQPGAGPVESRIGPVMTNPPATITARGNQFKEVTIRADGMPQIEVREVPGVSTGGAVIGQAPSPSYVTAPGMPPALTPRQTAPVRDEELARKLANLDRQLAELSGQVAALRKELQRPDGAPNKAPPPRQ